MTAKLVSSAFLLLLIFVLFIVLVFAAASHSESHSESSFENSLKRRVIGYLPGWSNEDNYDHTLEPLPKPETLSQVGYTTIIVAFGLFDVKKPGTIKYDNDTYALKINQIYIQECHRYNLEVTLSIGGAQTSLPDTTVHLDQIVQLAKSVYGTNYINYFIGNFITSVGFLMETYGFDGIDLDIEHGIFVSNPSPTTFLNPPIDSDIGILSSIVNKLFATYPNIIISYAPQSMNIECDWGWGSDSAAIYSSLILQTYQSISWVGIQLYQTGGCHGIDGQIYANVFDPSTYQINTPTFSVALATDLLMDWPQDTIFHFLPYKSYLKPNQVVLGYLSTDKDGRGDGNPLANIGVIKSAINCLKVGTETCGLSYHYQTDSIGGVFNWQIMWDQSNNFTFAKELQSCAIEGHC